MTDSRNHDQKMPQGVEEAAEGSRADGVTRRSFVLGSAAVTAGVMMPNLLGVGSTARAMSGVGIQLPSFDWHTISDSVPDGAIWWDPTSGDDNNDGSTKALAKKTFGAAESIIGSGGTVVVVGGTHGVPEITFTTSGAPGKRRTLMAEPGTEVVLVREPDFLGAMERTWNWTLIDSDLMIWESPDLGIPDGETIVNNVVGWNGADGWGEATNGLWGFMRIPEGAHGLPHLMRMMWYDLNGDYVSNAFHAPNTGPNADKTITNGGYAGPGFYLPGNGRVQVRMQKVTAAYSGDGWPTDGRLGTCVGPDGVWQEPITEDPNDYELHITRFTGDQGLSGPTLFNLNGQSWWHIKGINGALMQKAVFLPDGSENNWFEQCTWYPHGSGVDFRGSSRDNLFTRVQLLSGDTRSLAWEEHKQPQNYWFQYGRNVAFRGGDFTGDPSFGDVTPDTAAGTVWEHCTFFGWFDTALSLNGMDSTIVMSHCAILNNGDDGLLQTPSNGDHAFDLYYCYIAGGPAWSGQNNVGVGSRDWHCHHCVMDGRGAMLWAPLGGGFAAGVRPNHLHPQHSGGGNGPAYVRKMWNCTIVWSPDTNANSHNITLGPGIRSPNLPSGREHEIYNSIVTLMDNRRYDGPFGTTNDALVTYISCKADEAGIHRFDYNAYWRDVPNPVRPLFFAIQDSRLVGNFKHFASLAAFRASDKKVLSESMYDDGTDGHEEHGVEVDPGFVDLANRDYRPTHASVTSGAKDLSATGWPGAGHPHDFKGALDPNGDGSEVGPQDPPSAPATIGRWELDETSGTVAVDAEGNSDGTYTDPGLGESSLVSGDPGNSVDFNGTTSKIVVPHVSAFEVDTYSLVLYLSLDTTPTPGTHQVFLSKEHDPGGLSIGVYTGAGMPMLRGYTRDASGDAVWIGSRTGVAPLSTGTPYRVALTVDSAGTKLYLDDSLVAFSTNSQGLTTNQGPISIGAYNIGGPTSLAFVDSHIDNVSLYNAALTGTHITALPAAV